MTEQDDLSRFSSDHDGWLWCDECRIALDISGNLAENVADARAHVATAHAGTTDRPGQVAP